MDTSLCTSSEEIGEPAARTERKKPLPEFLWLFGGCCFLGRAGLGWVGECPAFAVACHETVSKCFLQFMVIVGSFSLPVCSSQGSGH